MNTPYTRILALLLATVILALAGTACHTVRGVGRDVESVGDHIESAAR